MILFLLFAVVVVLLMLLLFLVLESSAIEKFAKFAFAPKSTNKLWTEAADKARLHIYKKFNISAGQEPLWIGPKSLFKPDIRRIENQTEAEFVEDLKKLFV